MTPPCLLLLTKKKTKLTQAGPLLRMTYCRHIPIDAISTLTEVEAKAFPSSPSHLQLALGGNGSIPYLQHRAILGLV